ncbi:hypothetical protein H5410_060108 [Solanum commersonii]|uniref:Uncharacterized protein n=1 Tax=Solanum commersonii TaxID=4109 RepID=A0A9J5W5J5_SOLCO|nr:hypothetical protein H5410_060108 [Solanum commersonii]
MCFVRKVSYSLSCFIISQGVPVTIFIKSLKKICYPLILLSIDVLDLAEYLRLNTWSEDFFQHDALPQSRFADPLLEIVGLRTNKIQCQSSTFGSSTSSLSASSPLLVEHMMNLFSLKNGKKWIPKML